VVELSRPTDKVGRLELLTKVGSTRKRDGDVPGARKVLTAAADLARELGDATRFARVALTFGGGGWWGWWSDVTVVDQPAIDLLQEALDRLDPEDSKLRAAVTSMLAVVLYYSPEDERRERLAYEAIDMARRLGDQTTLAKSLLNCLVALWRPDNLDERMALADETVAAARACGHDAVENIARHFRAVAALEAGDIDTFRRLTGAIGAEVDKLDAASRAHVLSTECLIATMEGRFAEAEAMIKANYATSRRLSEIEAARTYMSQMSLLYRELGRNGELEEGNRRALEGDESRAAWRSSLALLLADNGRLDEAKAEFEIVAARDFVDTPKDATWSISMAMRSEIAYLVGDRRRAELLYELLTPYDGRFVVLFTRILYGGSFSYYLGALATTLDRWDDAERHFSAAVAENEGLGALPFVARAKLRWAEMLLRRGDPADRDRATHLHVEGRALASSLGLGHTGGDVQIRPAEGGVLSTQSD
jgi:tetratricopeptide (TPR) repeat protein